MGEIDKTFEWMDKAYEERDPTMFPIKTVPSHDNLHSDPRWRVFMKKMGFEE